MAAIVFTAPDDLRIVPASPAWLERCLLLLAGLWFVNIVNFMDGLDWMTVAEVVPVTAASSSSAGWRTSGSTTLSPLRSAAPCSDLHRSTGRWRRFSRRRRQPANRPAARLVPVAAVLASAIHRRAAASVVLSVRCHGDAAAPDRQARAVLGGASFAFLSARDRQRIYGFAGGGRSVHTQYRPCNIGDRIDRHNIYYDEDPISHCRGSCSGFTDLPVRAPASLTLAQLPLHHAGCQAQPFIESDCGAPAGCSGLGHIQLKGANDAVMRLRAAAQFEQWTKYGNRQRKKAQCNTGSS